MWVQRCPHLLSQQEVEDSLLAELALPAPAVDTIELEDARWFHLSWLERQLSTSGTLLLRSTSFCSLTCTLLLWKLEYATYGHCTVLFKVAPGLCSCSNQRGGCYQ